MSSAIIRTKDRRQEGYQSFTNPNQSPSFTNHYHNNGYINNVNHNTNNHATNVANNHFSISPGPNSFKQIEQIVYDESSSRHMHDRMLFLLFNLVGRNVIVTLKSGVKYQGFFMAACTDGGIGVVLRLAKRVLSKSEEKTTSNPAKESFIILEKDLMDIYATNVDFSASEKSNLEHNLGQENGDTWDQFAANEQLFGIATDFNEEIYTTKLDRSKADFKEREKAAIALANEINRTATTNTHMLEERGCIIDENQMDEEERYGAVIRNRDPKETKSFSSINNNKNNNGSDGDNILKAIPLTNGTAETTNEAATSVQKMSNLAQFRITEPIDVLIQKLDLPLPKDLIPILTKDESKHKLFEDKTIISKHSDIKTDLKKPEASEWKPNPNAASFTPVWVVTNTNIDRKSPDSSPFFGNQQLKKNSATIKDGFHKGKPLINPNTILVNPSYGFMPYSVAPFRYPNSTQYGVVSLQQPTQMSYMQPRFVPSMPFTTPSVPSTGAPQIYNPQIQPMVPQHFGSQGFPSPGCTPMIPNGMRPHMYQQYQNPHAIPPVMRYSVPQALPNLGQRPMMMMEPHYVKQSETNPI
ncbi:10321_t:CDS:10, partial [Entrophospora sp. SA101]